MERNEHSLESPVLHYYLLHMAHNNFSRSALNAKLKADLVVICLENSLSTSGIKADLVARILEWQDRPVVTEAAIDVNLDAMTVVLNLEECLEASTTPGIDETVCDKMNIKFQDTDPNELCDEEYYVNVFGQELGLVRQIADKWIAISTNDRVTPEFFSNPYSAALSLCDNQGYKKELRKEAKAVIALTTDFDYM